MAPCAAAETAFFSGSTRSVVCSRPVMVARKVAASGTAKRDPLSSTKSCVTSPSWPGSIEAPSTPITLIAMPRWVVTLSARMSPGTGAKRATTGKVRGTVNRPWLSVSGRLDGP